MEYGAIDLHLRRSQIRIIDEQEQVVLDRRIDTDRAAFAEIFGGRARMRILIESSTESEWVAQHLEGLGHEVVVVDPNYAAMYGARSRKVKTDKRDVGGAGAGQSAGRVSGGASGAAGGAGAAAGAAGAAAPGRAADGLHQSGPRAAAPGGPAAAVGARRRACSARLDRVALSPALQAALAPVRTAADRAAGHARHGGDGGRGARRRGRRRPSA